MTELTLSIQGRRTRVLSSGEGQALLLVHGFPLSADIWRTQLAAAPAGWRFLAPDLRGFGQADRVTPGESAGARSVADHAADVLAVADGLGLDRFVLGGISMGGYVSLAVMRAAAARVRALVLADTRADPDGDEARRGRAALRQQLSTAGAPGVADAMLPKLVAPATTTTNPDVARTLRTIIEGTSAPAIDDAIEALLTRPDSTGLLAAIACPTLIACGEEDALMNVGVHEDMQRRVGVSALAVIGRAGHMSNMEQPLAFNLALTAFLAALDKVGSA